jgi:glyoxylase-like metal-dependent hydrolase (beta-lactamase superfamily II)
VRVLSQKNEAQAEYMGLIQRQKGAKRNKLKSLATICPLSLVHVRRYNSAVQLFNLGSKTQILEVRCAVRRTLLLATIVAVGSLAIRAAAFQVQTQRAPLPAIEKVKHNLYVLFGSDAGDRPKFTGGNVGVFVTDAGVVLVDTKLAGYGPEILAQVKSVTAKPVTTIINTHTHGDHTGSNEAFPATVEFVAHENTKANMERMDAFKGDKAKFLPKRTYKDKLSIGTGNDRVDLYYFGPGHTNGDTFVVYPAHRVLQTGDMFAWRDAPFLDRSNGGTGVEMPNTLSNAIAALKDIETVIPGHSPLMTMKELREFQRFTADLLSDARAALKAGKSSEQAAASLTFMSKYPGYKSDRAKAAIDAIYDELKAK